MGHRLTKIYTRTGDDGSTGLGTGARVSKEAQRVEAMGEVDELNAVLGRLVALSLPAEAQASLLRVQHELFELGSELCLPGTGYIRLGEAQVTRLEQETDFFNEPLGPLKEFILPGGHPWAAEAHVARTVCRRVERHLVALFRAETGNPFSAQYINRLSDLLFVMARWLNLQAGRGDVLWQQLESGAQALGAEGAPAAGE